MYQYCYSISATVVLRYQWCPDFALSLCLLVQPEQMASPFTEMEFYTILFSLVVFSLFTLHGLIQERCVHTTGMTNTHKQCYYIWFTNPNVVLKKLGTTFVLWVKRTCIGFHAIWKKQTLKTESLYCSLSETKNIKYARNLIIPIYLFILCYLHCVRGVIFLFKISCTDKTIFFFVMTTCSDNLHTL